METAKEQKQKIISGLRNSADLLEKHIDVIPNFSLSANHNIVFDTKEEMQKAIQAIGGKWRKEDGPLYFWVTQAFEGFSLTFFISRELVCERKVVGKRIVPLQEAIPEHEEDVVEWQCGTLLGA